MVRRTLFLVTLAAAALALACSGGSNSSSPTAAPRSNGAPTRAPAGPTATVDPRSGPPGSEITVSGSGWMPGVQIDVTARVPAGRTATPYTTVVADQGGRFTARFRLEKAADGSDLQTGRYDLIVRSSSVVVDVPFQVETRRPVGGPGPGG
jgi:hypothetical protein